MKLRRSATLNSSSFFLIHLIEGYVLNPRVYSSYMRINSVIILIILTLAGKLFGFWGLLLGVPVCTYIFGYAIRPNHPLVFPDLDGKGAQNAPLPAGAGMAKRSRSYC